MTERAGVIIVMVVFAGGIGFLVAHLALVFGSWYAGKYKKD